MKNIVPWVVTGNALLVLGVTGIVHTLLGRVTVSPPQTSPSFELQKSIMEKPLTTDNRNLEALDTRDILFDIKTVDLEKVQYKIPITLLSTSTLYNIGEVLHFSYDYPNVLAKSESYEDFCDEQSAEKHAITSFYLLNDISGEIVSQPAFHNYQDGNPRAGAHNISWDSKNMIKFGGQDNYIASTTSGRYRLLIVSRIPNPDPKPTCLSNKSNHGPVQWIDSWTAEGHLLSDSTSTLRGIGYTASFTLKSNTSVVSQPVSTSKNKFLDWKTYSDPKHGLQFKYPASWGVSYNSYSERWFQVLIDKNSSSTEQSLDQIYGENETSGPGSTYCHDGLCKASGREVIYGKTKWVHINKPYSCPSETCPTGEVYRTSKNDWTYYLEFKTEEEALIILNTFQLI